MKTKTFFFLLCFVVADTIAQNNKIGIGFNFGNTWNYKRSSKAEFSFGPKLYYERKLINNLSLRGNIDLLLSAFYSLSLDGTILYKIDITKDYKIAIGVGAGYYYYNNNHGHISSHGYNISKDEFLYVKIIEGGTVGLNGIVSLVLYNIPLEVKFILSPFTGDERIYNSSSNKTIRRSSTTYIKSLLFSVAVPFEL